MDNTRLTAKRALVLILLTPFAYWREILRFLVGLAAIFLVVGFYTLLIKHLWNGN